MTAATLREYFAPRDDGTDFAGVRRIPISTPKGTFSVWTRRIGSNPRTKVLLLHGGPGGGHEFFEPLQPWLGAEGVEFYLYDQLGSPFSDQPDDDDLWTMERFVDEVEQVRAALGLTRDDFYLLGLSWGGMLAVEYALTHGQHLKGLVLANTTSSVPDFNRYSRDVLARAMDPAAVTEIRALEAAGRFDDPRYMELLYRHFLSVYMCRLSEWPDGLRRAVLHWNRRIREVVFGLGMLTLAGRHADWDRSRDLHRIEARTLVIGSTYDSFDPEHSWWMSTQVRHGSYHHCPKGSHGAIWDDQAAFAGGLTAFLRAG